MLVIPYFDPDTSTFSYLVGVRDSNQAAVIDPVLGFDPVSGRTDTSLAERQHDELERRGWTLRWILETHAHADHLSAAQWFRQRSDAPVVIGRGITEVQRRFKKVYGLDDGFPIDGRQFDRLVEDGDTLELGDHAFTVMATPGHTSDSVTYRIGRCAFVGDTLFMPDYGTARCDFPGGDAGTLYDSIQRIHSLPAHTRLYLCHDYPGDDREPCCEISVAHSKAENIHVKVGVEREAYVAFRQQRDAGLPLPRLILPAIQVNIRAGHLPEADANGVSYLRLPIDADLSRLAR